MEIINASYLISRPEVAQCPAGDKPEFAFIGRSNVGKSSLLNMLTGQQRLAKTSAAPGKTQMINHFVVKSRNSATAKSVAEWYMVDLPGYGYAKVSQKNRKSWGKMIEDYLRKRENLLTTFVLIDSRHEPQTIDLEFVNQMGEWQLPFAIVFTKADKMKPGGLQRNVDLFAAALRENWEALPPFFISSSTDKSGKQEILNYVQGILKSVS
ncbi:MAG: ribosome biogenesis GTP-binding protein YihA/YsxC [Bacteroidetes bacterium]|uniref:ribosome biogenesis GTP-binding protein YihA/YsxC n=1 Tax=Phnomibacter sp. TaxID=2836217 RepID=UPI002FDCBC0A|nr:ribosome biogenesis GTP-binding protein YihA/YsxC [Bacteroidota bacterium]